MSNGNPVTCVDENANVAFGHRTPVEKAKTPKSAEIAENRPVAEPAKMTCFELRGPERGPK